MPPYNEETLDSRSMTEVVPMDPESHCPSKTFLTNGIKEATEDQEVKSGCDNTEKYKCMFCSKGFTLKSNMKRHLRTHTGERPFSCPECDCKFSHKSSLIVHRRLHTGEKPFTCEICQKSFRSGPNLISHRRHHNDDRPFACQICGKKFIHKSHLAAHKSRHSEEKPFACQHCDKRFSQVSSLNRHSEVHKERDIFICDICGKNFVKELSLKYHQKAHSGVKDHECKECGRLFQFKNSLNRHIRENKFSCGVLNQNRNGSSRARYECAVCLKVFKKKNLLRTHINGHLGEKPFECQECGKKFTVARSVTHHLKLSCKGKLRNQDNESKLCLPSSVHPPLDIGETSRSVYIRDAKQDLTKVSNPRSECNDGISLPVSANKTKSSLIVKVEKMTEQLSLNQNLFEKPGSLLGHSKMESNSLNGVGNSVKSENNADYGESSSLPYTCQKEDHVTEGDVCIKEEIEIKEEEIDDGFS